jgi:hypothetical protein
MRGVMGCYSTIAVAMNAACAGIPEGKPLRLSPLQDHVLHG